MISKLKKTMLILFIFIAVIALSGYVYMQQPQFGKNPAELRFERIRTSPHYKNGAFQNEHFTPDLAEGVTYFDILKLYIPKVENKEPSKALPSVKTDLKNISSDKPVVVWFGHSSYFMHIDGKNILVDPVFSGNASPVSFFGANYNGSNVYSIDDFPELDLLIITHDHYDHLDYETVKKLQPKVKRVVTSLGVGSHLAHWGYDESQITELDWWEKTKLDSTFDITAAPARHFSGRGFKRMQTFWSSFILKTPQHNIYVGGDSGYDTHFKEIGDKYGPFDLAILECGQYNDYWKYIHLMPEETAQAAVELRAKLLLPVHWSKFTLALHPWNESIQRVTKKAKALNQPITTPMIGEKVEVGGGEYPVKEWWNY
ncbi:MBL fold metallo-hydrolase [Runella rosea]|uniref:MBL fold metallo-hydrolase n=2 Tax=Runella rosea TaxID=2259595 RepID=A0A344TG15_9BACT|nr:MBL fold metallo-hydrolase [Runella rosea]